jgi:two-component system, LytTR family, sensor kinase
MKELMRINNKQLHLHIFAWLLVIVYLILVARVQNTFIITVFSRTLIALNYMLVFYSLSLYIFPKYWESNRVLLFANIILILIIYWINRYLITLKVVPAIGGSSTYQSVNLLSFLNGTLYFFIIAGSAGAASFFSRYGLYRLKMQAQKEKLLLVKEINLMKTRFNPQLTFNFLNYCYIKTQQYSPETAESITLFSEMLKYTIKTRPDEKVALSKEIIYIENFISLQKLLSAKVYVNFDYEGEVGNKYILPRILITFVENAFKHGLTNDAQYPICIFLKVEGNNLFFTIKNKIKPHKVNSGSGTGLENVGHILELHYANNYDLMKDVVDDFYNVRLMMRL